MQYGLADQHFKTYEEIIKKYNSMNGFLRRTNIFFIAEFTYF